MTLAPNGQCTHAVTLFPNRYTWKCLRANTRVVTSNLVGVYFRSASLVALLAYAIGCLQPSLSVCLSTAPNPFVLESVHSWNCLVRSVGCSTGAETSLCLISQKAASHSSVQSKLNNFLVSRFERS